MSQKDKYNNLVQSIKDDEEKEKEQNRFDATLEQTKEAHSLARKTLDATREANEANAKTLKGLNAATQSADNAISGICSAIVKAQQTPVRTRLDDESLKQLHDSHTHGWDRRNRHLTTITSSKKKVGRSIANDSQT